MLKLTAGTAKEKIKYWKKKKEPYGSTSHRDGQILLSWTLFTSYCELEKLYFHSSLYRYCYRVRPIVIEKMLG